MLTNGTQAAVQPVGANTLAAGDLVVTGWQSHQRKTSASPMGASPMGASPVGGAMRGIH
jgi:hypothetical protein